MWATVLCKVPYVTSANIDVGFKNPTSLEIAIYEQSQSCSNEGPLIRIDHSGHLLSVFERTNHVIRNALSYEEFPYLGISVDNEMTILSILFPKLSPLRLHVVLYKCNILYTVLFAKSIIIDLPSRSNSPVPPQGLPSPFPYPDESLLIPYAVFKVSKPDLASAASGLCNSKCQVPC